MARPVQIIKADLTTPFMANEVLAEVYQFVQGASFEANFSPVSTENILFDLQAFAVFIFEQILDQHKIELTDALANQKAGTLPWYRTMALRFLYGFDLIEGYDLFDLGEATAEQIKAASVVKYAAVDEATLSSRVIIKIAGEDNGVLAPLSSDQKESFDAYINEVRFAGVAITVINYLPDRLYLTLQIKRDALVLDDSGMSILNGNYPVNDAIAEYMKELPFNGELRLSALVDKLQKVPGVLDATVMNAESAWINPDTNGYGEPEQITISTIPVSGYFEVVTYDNIAYVV